jgi:chromosome segregation ATPase
LGENALLRDQLDNAEAGHGGSSEELAAALSEINTLKEELSQAQASGGGGEELAQVTEERDNVRRDYIELREQLEDLKHEFLQSKKEAKKNAGAKPVKADTGEVDKLKQELEDLREQLSAKTDVSAAHRGLALSQKALQELRETLREANEAAATAKASLEAVKKENATLLKQNQALQSKTSSRL